MLNVGNLQEIDQDRFAVVVSPDQQQKRGAKNRDILMVVLAVKRPGTPLLRLPTNN